MAHVLPFPKHATRVPGTHLVLERRLLPSRRCPVTRFSAIRRGAT